MRAIEFKSKIKDNQIKIPAKLQSELHSKEDKDVRVIVLIDDSERSDDYIIRRVAQNQFLQGYADTDSVYDN
jgi:bifunctional DNA-binding transcriptional regulator/antitoxin component of YhaV-PrlF toxin-antitoxin module